MQFPLWPQFNKRTAGRIARVLKSGKVNYWTGDYGKKFEAAFAKWVGSTNAISVANGTAALDMALKALGIGKGDEVICTPYSFIASSMCALYNGAVPIFCDVGTDHLMNPAKIENLVTRRTKAIVVVHLFGMVADMGPILKIAKRRGLVVIEDCAQCLGGEYGGRKVGTLGDIGCFSFCQAKHFTTGGEGGMVVTDNDDLANRIRSLRDHGRDGRGRNAHHVIVGRNERMTEIQSVIGLGELERLDKWNLPRRRELAKTLIEGLADHPLVRYAPIDTEKRRSSFWLVPFTLDVSKLSVSIPEFVDRVRAAGGSVYEILWPIAYKEKAFVGSNCRGRCPMAESLPPATIGFWVHPTYAKRHILSGIKAFKKVAAETMI